jgi:NAD(P)-dependent dehydrogenase (short-subunit alcohol dehydrogenase family)
MSKRSGTLPGRRVVLTGASRGIGLAVARRLLEERAEVLGVGRTPSHLARARVELARFGSALQLLHVDVSRPESAESIRRAVEQRWGALDLLINNAAIMVRSRSFEAEGPSDLAMTLATNFLAPHRLILALLPLLRRGNLPRIINVSSAAGMLADRGGDFPSYRLSKLALNRLTLMLADELRGEVSVLALDPGWVKTEMGGDDAPEELEAAAERAVAAAVASPSLTGKFLKGATEMPW